MWKAGQIILNQEPICQALFFTDIYHEVTLVCYSIMRPTLAPSQGAPQPQLGYKGTISLGSWCENQVFQLVFNPYQDSPDKTAVVVSLPI